MANLAFLLGFFASASGLTLGGLVHRPNAIGIRRGGSITCGWGPDPVWSSLSVTSIDTLAEGLKEIIIKPPTETIDGYTIPGQYVQIREPGAEKAGFFAIASAPGASPLEFLIKETPPSDWSPGTGWLTSATAGVELEMSQVMGSGFKFAEQLDNVDRVLLFAVGSGISPIRSVIESGALADKEVELYYGVRTPDMAAYSKKLDGWEKLGVKVQSCISAAGEAAGKAEQGYVQDVAKEMGAFSKAPDKTLVLMCGMKGMAEGIKEMCAEAGIDEARVLANF